jgi:hypothetical protein
MLRVAFLLLALVPSGLAQRLSVGVKGGVLLTEDKARSAVSGRTGSGEFSINQRPYTVGPTIEIGLPLHFRIEADMLFKRFSTTESRFFNPLFGTITRLAANNWEFPLLLKYQFPGRRMPPFVAAGGSLRHLWGMKGSTESFTFGFEPPYRVERFETGSSKTVQGGITLSAGLRTALGPLKVLPEIRYTHWTSLSFQPNRDQAEFLLGLGF